MYYVIIYPWLTSVYVACAFLDDVLDLILHTCFESHFLRPATVFFSDPYTAPSISQSFFPPELWLIAAPNGFVCISWIQNCVLVESPQPQLGQSGWVFLKPLTFSPPMWYLHSGRLTVGVNSCICRQKVCEVKRGKSMARCGGRQPKSIHLSLD